MCKRSIEVSSAGNNKIITKEVSFEGDYFYGMLTELKALVAIISNRGYIKVKDRGEEL